MDRKLFQARDEDVMTSVSFTPSIGGSGIHHNTITATVDEPAAVPAQDQVEDVPRPTPVTSEFKANPPRPIQKNRHPPPSKKPKSVVPAKQVQFAKPIASYEDTQPVGGLGLDDFSTFAGATPGKDPVLDAAKKAPVAAPLNPKKRHRNDAVFESDSSGDESGSSDSGSDESGSDDDGPVLPAKKAKTTAANAAFIDHAFSGGLPGRDEDTERAEIIYKIERRIERSGKHVVIPKDGTLKELRMFAAKFEYGRKSESAVKAYRQNLITALTVAESLAVETCGMDDMEGWKECFKITMSELDEIFYDIYDEYGSKWKTNPLLELAMVVARHGVMYRGMKRELVKQSKEAREQHPQMFSAIPAARPAEVNYDEIKIEPPQLSDDMKAMLAAPSITAPVALPPPRVEVNADGKTRSVDLGGPPAKRTTTATRTIVRARAPKPSNAN